MSSVQFSCSVMSDSLRPHESQDARPPCPSPLPEFTQTHVHQVSDAIQPSHPLSSPSSPAPNPSQHQSLFQLVNSGLHRTVQLSFFSITVWGIGLDYCDIEWFALEMNRDHSVVFEIASKYCILDLLLTMMATPFLLRDSCPQ